MRDDTPVAETDLKESLLDVLQRIRTTALSSNSTELPVPEFSNGLNAVGEEFIDELLQQPRTGRWWLDENGRWLECTVCIKGRRTRSTFLRGDSSEWEWFPKDAHRLADPMTGPDHVVEVSLPAKRKSFKVVVEQKLRFGSKQDAFATGSTYMKHLRSNLRYPAPDRDTEIDNYCDDLLAAAREHIKKTTSNGRLTYSGKVPHVCFASVMTPPGKIYISSDDGQAIECSHVGFLAPTMDYPSISEESSVLRVLQRARVSLWISVEQLISQCSNKEVLSAWTRSIEELTQHVFHPDWR